MRIALKNRVSIDERPHAVEDKSADTVTAATIDLLKSYEKAVVTITALLIMVKNLLIMNR